MKAPVEFKPKWLHVPMLIRRLKIAYSVIALLSLALVACAIERLLRPSHALGMHLVGNEGAARTAKAFLDGFADHKRGVDKHQSRADGLHQRNIKPALNRADREEDQAKEKHESSIVHVFQNFYKLQIVHRNLLLTGCGGARHLPRLREGGAAFGYSREVA